MLFPLPICIAPFQICAFHWMFAHLCCYLSLIWPDFTRELANLPLKDFPQRGVLDPAEAGDGAGGHGAPKQHLNTAVILCIFRERHHLMEESEMSQTNAGKQNKKPKFKKLPCIPNLEWRSCPNWEAHFQMRLSWRSSAM